MTTLIDLNSVVPFNAVAECVALAATLKRDTLLFYLTPPHPASVLRRFCCGAHLLDPASPKLHHLHTVLPATAPIIDCARRLVVVVELTSISGA
jgi:hypothetical protein